MTTPFPSLHLMPEERRLLFKFCWNHPVTRCFSCKHDYKITELGMDFLGSRMYLCPICRDSLEDSVRSHLMTCTVISIHAEEVRKRAEATRRESRLLQKDSQQARDRAEVLGAEAESLRDGAERLRRQRLTEEQ